MPRFIMVNLLAYNNGRIVTGAEELTSIKANLGKPRDAKPRVLASSDKSWKTPPKDSRVAGPPPYLDEQHEGVCKNSVYFDLHHILCVLQWGRKRRISYV